jgi:polar amino acid transport system substrate-binding protein
VFFIAGNHAINPLTLKGFCMKNFILLAFMAFWTLAPSSPRAAEESVSAYTRVINSGVLRCGYSPWPSLIDVDPNTKQLSGTFYDYMNELGRLMELKIEWTIETSFGEMPEALNTGKIDAHCSGSWTNPIRGKFIDATIPISYQYVAAIARTDDNRFDNNLEAINDPAIKVSTVDGESASVIAATYFPKATPVSNPQGTEGVQMLLDVITGKADVAFTETSMLERALKENPGKLKKIKTPYPLQIFGNSIWIKKGEDSLRNSLNLATMQLINDGSVDKILNRYETSPGLFLRPATGYRPAP